jgi:hypothetical protein
MTKKKKPIRHSTYSLFVCHWRDAWAYFIIHRQTGVEVDMTVVPTLARARREGQAAFAKASVLARDSDIRIDMRIRPPSRPVPRPKGRRKSGWNKSWRPRPGVFKRSWPWRCRAF